MRWIGALLLVAAALLAPPVAARDVPPAIAEVRLDELPVEARNTLEQIRRGGPYPYRKDGSVFGNREKRLPAQPRGYYTEYTVKTPYSRDRGARRIVAGRGAGRNPATSGEYYYTDDHYNSFRRIRE
jgi:ribonuclease T1